MKKVSIVELHRYPVKSLGGIDLQEAILEEKGITFDRNWLVTTPSGKFITQREIPRMALIKTSINEVGDLLLEAEGRAPLTVAKTIHTESTEFKRVTVWRDECYAVDEGDAAAEWLSTFLNTKTRLVKMKDDFVRPVIDDGKHFEDTSVRFQDQYPLLIISRASLKFLNDKLAKPVPMNRFRPNIVVDDCEAFEEDSWTALKSEDGLTLTAAKGCARCVITTTDQLTAQRSVEPLKTLATFRGTEEGVMFGQNYLVAKPGKLCVGDTLVIE
ncbi:MAG: MOSC N-terminal beta barrel domain-containing protein [Leptolyngbya sp.]|nr:MOSC N-terminal beta barrel domain-containing protein [Candidatus Melainabacteria bacterium]